jgi:hypothetical protein
MPLRSALFAGDPQLEACLVSDPAHVVPGSTGNHVRKIQQALETLDGATIPDDEKDSSTYGPATTDAVLHYKTVRSIINFEIQNQADNIVGKRTIKSMDDELVGGTGSRPDMIATAFADSRRSLTAAAARLQGLLNTADLIDSLPEPDRTITLAQLHISHARDIEVIARRLVVPADPMDLTFRNALQAALGLMRDNLAQPLTIIDQGATGRCVLPSGGVPFAATIASDPDPRVSVCDPFFASSRDLQRDVATHEYFHLLGLGDNSVTNTAEALTNANTIAQIAALIHDRFRQANSDGNEQAIPLFPMP